MSEDHNVGDTSKNHEVTESTNEKHMEDVESIPITKKDSQLWRDLVAYWILGLCNNYGYVVMLSAAHDIIEQFDEDHGKDTESAQKTERMCNIVSTGTILLADILPSLCIKLLAPFIPFFIHIRMIVSIGLAAAGFLLVAFAETSALAILGVVCTSLSSGLGETTILGYSSRYNKNVISTWSSGTGGAGIIGSLSYAGLRSLNVSPVTTMLIMLVFPAIEAISFWILLRRPSNIIVPTKVLEPNATEYATEDTKPLLSFMDKLKYTTSLFKYMIPLTLVYFLEYFINQGLFELVDFKDIFLDKPSQYRWLNVDYQIGVFISRSSVNLFQVNKIWLMSVFQFINVVYFLIEVIFYVTPNIWIVFAVVLWEGLLGGGAYVNTFYRMSKEIPNARQTFAMGMVVQADSFGIAIAGLLAIPVHNAICQLSLPNRAYVF